MTSNLNSILAAYKDACDHLKRVTASELLAAFAEKFKANPSVKCMIWHQYTPYFNDGDPCTFGVHSDYACRARLPMPGDVDTWTVVAGAAPIGDPATYMENADFFDGWEYKDERNNDAQQTEMDSFLNGLPDDLLARALGDGVRVFVWEGGILTDEYSHD
jgi:hypothetical protein